MAPEGDLRPEPVLAALGVRDAALATPVTGGTATSIWRVERPGGPCALRVFRRGEDDVWRRELAAMEAARAAGVRVPAVHAAGSWEGRPAMLLGWGAGEPLADALLRRPWRIWRLGLAFGRAQAAIHRAAPPAVWSADEDAWIGWAGPADEELQRRLRAARRGPPALLHLDYHPRNVLVDASDVTAVLDWANARPGDPRADAARTYTMLVVEPWQPGRQPLGLALARRVLATAWRAGYQSLAGPLGRLDLFYAWAGAVMERDLAWRVEDPRSWWGPRQIEQIRGWTARWRRALGPPV